MPNERLSKKSEFILKSLFGSPPSSHQAFLSLTVLVSDTRCHQFKGVRVVPLLGFSWVVLVLYLNSKHTYIPQQSLSGTRVFNCCVGKSILLNHKFLIDSFEIFFSIISRKLRSHLFRVTSFSGS